MTQMTFLVGQMIVMLIGWGLKFGLAAYVCVSVCKSVRKFAAAYEDRA